MFKRQLTSALVLAMLGGFAVTASAENSGLDSPAYQAYLRYLDAGLVKSKTDSTTGLRESGYEAYQRYLDISNVAAKGTGDDRVSSFAAASTFADYQRAIGWTSEEATSSIAVSRLATGQRRVQ